jgi:hypothetical protein
VSERVTTAEATRVLKFITNSFQDLIVAKPREESTHNHDDCLFDLTELRVLSTASVRNFSIAFFSNDLLNAFLLFVFLGI